MPKCGADLRFEDCAATMTRRRRRRGHEGVLALPLPLYAVADRCWSPTCDPVAPWMWHSAGSTPGLAVPNRRRRLRCCLTRRTSPSCGCLRSLEWQSLVCGRRRWGVVCLLDLVNHRSGWRRAAAATWRGEPAWARGDDGRLATEQWRRRMAEDARSTWLSFPSVLIDWFDERDDSNSVSTHTVTRHKHAVNQWRREKNFRRASPIFLALQVQLVVLVSAFVMVSTVWSVSCLLFYSRCPRGQPFVKVEGTCLPCPMESVPLLSTLYVHEHEVRRYHCTSNSFQAQAYSNLRRYTSCCNIPYLQHGTGNHCRQNDVIYSSYLHMCVRPRQTGSNVLC